MPTVYGIETLSNRVADLISLVATVPTVYGIETRKCTFNFKTFNRQVATVPTVYGIETYLFFCRNFDKYILVATVPTVYGIETHHERRRIHDDQY